MTRNSAKPRVPDAGLFRARRPLFPAHAKAPPRLQEPGRRCVPGGSLFCQLNITTSSRGVSAGSTARAVSTGPAEPGVWPW